ncbi:MAG: hypothetical protein DVB31_11410 [Verrucomicrobia bacterium]|nr:MAG: hypothetical protein DVB31_11410 [Verrucomicrobiota bacterium]
MTRFRPNPDDDAWFRLCVAIDGFRARYGRWPTRVRLDAPALASIRSRMGDAADAARIDGLIRWVVDGSAMVAEDDGDRRYSFGDEGCPAHRPIPGAAAWLGLVPKPREGSGPAS